ncbi:MAG: hypothetical protein JXB20_02870 [Bacilli bacterium]|nr:hypothetical protein [Bacilli bacterium]
MKKQFLERVSIILFFGSLWGIIEASIGYLLHLLPALIAGSLMFPIVAYIMLRAYASGRSKLDLLFIGVVAAAIKSINLFMPAYSVFKTINPMVSIVLESLVVVAVIGLLDHEKISARLIALTLASVSWRLLYLGYMGVQYLLTEFVAQQLQSFDLAFEFVVIGGILSGAAAIVAYFLSKSLDAHKVTNLANKFWLALPTLGAAIFLTIIL